MEKLVTSNLAEALQILSSRRVLITGHTGFKGTWLCALLSRFGCKIAGYSLEPPTAPAHFDLLDLSISDTRADICDAEHLVKTFDEFKPEVVFHLAAQPLVRASYEDPTRTFATNVMGTVNALEACRRTPEVRAVVVVTSDKCYENREWGWAYRENDPMGGHDPYSASKGCAEIVTASYRRSFFSSAANGKGSPLVASARSGNVLGGGDWGEGRIMPDLIRATVNGKNTFLRNPASVRPWQHVLDPLAGYVLLAARLLSGEEECAQPWNFGPTPEGCVSVETLARTAAKHWSDMKFEFGQLAGPHESDLLVLDSSMARRRLGWTPVWPFDVAIERTVRWYHAFYKAGEVSTLTDLDAYLADSGVDQ